MTSEHEQQFRGVSADRYDLAGARSWMSDICGPHMLKASKPNRIQFHHSGNVLRSTSTLLGYVEYGTDVTIGVGAQSKLNSYSISLPLSGEQELCKAGMLLRSDRDRGVIISPHEQQELTIAGDCRKLQVVIPRTAIQQTLEELLQRSVDEQLSFDADMDAINGATASWWRMARHMTDELERSRDLYGQVFFSRDLESALIKGLILAQPNNYSNELRTRLEIKLPYYLVRARDFIHANAREELHLEDIEQAAGVSRFKLFEGFRKYFGVAPMAYLKKYRLTAVRQEILEDRSQRNISVIAMGWGFNHLGRFSSEYRKLFDEAPSTTLQRAEARRIR
ncbi:helix-turn-helix domain-containing protein [Pseudomonas entomophila]|uniref:AraC family transcriptional regulator n=1 Tax=Pseudomonas entomophila TaxID=312306 RepID=UPI0023D8043D|nr:helix-turn-helix domain-containing protein [Pseudomonas entomophila]MDF0730126.1 helix-turn-helix domain-containing protein [Pseudomonas entomophila]